MTDPTTQDEQDARMRALLHRLELASHGTTQTWGGPGRAGESSAVLPAGEAKPLHVELRIAYNHARTWGRRQDLIELAERELGAFKRTAPAEASGETRDDLLTRLVRDVRVVDLPPEQVTTTTDYCGLRPREVASARVRAGLSPDTGRALAPVGLGADREADIDRMRAEGMSVRQIAFRLGLPKSTIQDLAARKAA